MSRTKTFALPLVLTVTIGACSAQTPPSLSTAPLAETTEPSCGADLLGDYVGRRATDDVIAAIRAWRGDHAIRVLKPDSMATMDYRPDRLNIDVDADGIIKGFRCT
jgi:hypothetical protein